MDKSLVWILVTESTGRIKKEAEWQLLEETYVIWLSGVESVSCYIFLTNCILLTEGLS
jgi:hypothetical protein